MAKQARSIRIDEDLLEVFAEYSKLLKETFGYSLSLSTVVNEAMAGFIMDSAEKWVTAMVKKSVVEPLPNGKMKRYEFDDEQIERMNKIANDAGIVYHSMQE